MKKLTNQLKNYYGGFLGVILALLIYLIIYFIAFMTAYGNPTPAARIVLQLTGYFFFLANPLVYFPLSYAIGALLIRDGDKDETI